MKKILAMVLAMMLVLSMSAAFAEDEWDGTYDASATTNFTFVKTYNDAADGTIAPDEEVEFVIAQNGTANPDGTMIYINDTVDTTKIASDNKYKIDVDANLSTTVTVQVPSYTKAGKYLYTITETDGNTAGVTDYNTENLTIYVEVLVEYDNDPESDTFHDLVITQTKFIAKNNANQKDDSFNNKFEHGSFTVAKNVEGNMSNETEKFEITVTLTSDKPVLTPILVGGEEIAYKEWKETDGEYTYVATLNLCEKDGATTFAQIPYGVVVEVAETEKDMKGYTLQGYTLDAATATVNSVEFEIGAEDANDTVVVENYKDASVNTGISLDNAPYMILMALVVVAGAALIVKRASANR